MSRLPVLLVFALAACTGGPIDTRVDDTGDTSDTSDTADTNDTSDTSDTGGTNPDAADGIFRDCAEAQASGVDLAPGTYNGTTDDWTPTLDGTCVGSSATGPDKMFRIEVPDNTTLSIDFQVSGNDAKVYLVDNCALSSTCIATANAAGGNATESLEWTNTAGVPHTVYAILDTRDPASAGDTWTLSVSMETFTPPPTLDMTDTCSGFESTDPITASGSWAIAMDGYGDDWDLYYDATTSCTGYQSAGPDGVVPVEVPDGATLTATWGHPSCDTSVYVLETCGDANSCLGGMDDWDSLAETVEIQNTTGQDATWALVLDHYSSGCLPTAASPGTLEVTLDAPTEVAFDTCTAAESAAAVATGTHYVSLGAANPDLDLASATASCTGAATPGDDLFLPVSIPAGKELVARFTPAEGDAALYFVTACDDADTCEHGVDLADPELLEFVNEGASPLDGFLVIDSKHLDGDASEPTSGFLSVNYYTPLDDIRVADTCAELDAVDPVTEGTHTVVLEGFAADVNPNSTCSGWSASGVDGFLEVRLLPRETVIVTYDAACDVSLHLYDTCGDPDACLVGSDEVSSDPEEVTWTNDSLRSVNLVIGMDAWSSCVPDRTNPGTLTVDIVPPPQAGADTCADAELKTPVGTGIFPLDLSAATATMDPADESGCGEVTAASGAELFVPVAVGEGEALSLTLDPDAGNPALYLVEDCSDVATCLDGADSAVPEILVWENDGPATVVYAVIDTDAPDADPGEPQAAFLEVWTYLPDTLITAGDDCAAAAGLGPVGSGRYRISLDGMADDIDLEDGDDPPCTNGQRTPGNDAFVQVVLQDGQTLEASWDASISTSGITNGSLYLVDGDCDADACLVGSDIFDPEFIEWTNETGSEASLFVVMDAWSTAGGPDAGILDMSITP